MVERPDGLRNVTYVMRLLVRDDGASVEAGRVALVGNRWLEGSETFRAEGWSTTDGRRWRRSHTGPRGTWMYDAVPTGDGAFLAIVRDRGDRLAVWRLEDGGRVERAATLPRLRGGWNVRAATIVGVGTVVATGTWYGIDPPDGEYGRTRYRRKDGSPDVVRLGPAMEVVRAELPDAERAHFFDVAATNRDFVIIGEDERGLLAWRSSDGQTWTPPQVLPASYDSDSSHLARALVHDARRDILLVLGHPDRIWRSERGGSFEAVGPLVVSDGIDGGEHIAGVALADGFLVAMNALGSMRLQTSPDGRSWTPARREAHYDTSRAQWLVSDGDRVVGIQRARNPWSRDTAALIGPGSIAAYAQEADRSAASPNPTHAGSKDPMPTLIPLVTRPREGRSLGPWRLLRAVRDPSEGASFYMRDLERLGEGLVALGSACLKNGGPCADATWHSTDAVIWQPASLPGEWPQVLAMTGAPHRTVAVGHVGQPGAEERNPAVWSTNDGLTWSRHPAPPVDNPMWFVAATDDAVVVTAGEHLWVTTDLSHWRRIDGPAAGWLAHGPGGFLVLTRHGSDGSSTGLRLWRSSTGMEWTPQRLPRTLRRRCTRVGVQAFPLDDRWLLVCAKSDAPMFVSADPNGTRWRRLPPSRLPSSPLPPFEWVLPLDGGIHAYSFDHDEIAWWLWTSRAGRSTGHVTEIHGVLAGPVEWEGGWIALGTAQPARMPRRSWFEEPGIRLWRLETGLPQRMARR